MDKKTNWRSLKGRVNLFFFAFCTLFVLFNLILALALWQKNGLNTLSYKLLETKQVLHEFNQETKKPPVSKVEFRTSIRKKLKTLRIHFEDIFSLHRHDLQSIVEQLNTKTKDQEVNALLNEANEEDLYYYLAEHWLNIKNNSRLFFEEEPYTDSIYYETQQTDSAGIDPETGQVIRLYATQRTKKILNPLFAELINYNELESEFVVTTIDEIYENTLDKISDRLVIIYILVALDIVLAVLLVILGVAFIRKTFIQPISILSNHSKELLQGEQSILNYQTSFEHYHNIGYCLDQFNSYINSATQFVKNVTNDNLETDLQIDKSESGQNNELAKALVEMRDKMIEVDRIEKERNWEIEGLAHFAELIQRNSDNLDKLTNILISELVKYLDANQGGLFIINSNDEEDIHLELAASFAFDRQKFISKRLEYGEGLTGQVWQEKETIYVKDLPESHMVIKSGLGDAGPTSLLIVPLIDNDEIHGVIELASFREFKGYQISFVEKLSSSIAASLATVEMSRKTQSLLKNSQELTEKLISQEESMRQNIEEMQVTHENQERELRATKLQYETKLSKLEARINDYKTQLKKLPKSSTTQLEKKLQEQQRTIEELENTIKIKDMKINKLSSDKN